MDKLTVANSFEDALEMIKHENPDMKISVWNGDVHQLEKVFELKEYPIPVNKSLPKHLIKFGEEEHMLSLLQKGEVYMQTLGYFKHREETEDGRADPDEGAHSIVQTGGMIIGNLKLDMSPALTFHSPSTNRGYVYCTTAFNGEFSPDAIPWDRMSKTGRTAVVIFNPAEFVRRCKAVLNKYNYTLDVGYVRYYNEKEGSYFLDPWLKKVRFRTQNEFRLFFPRKEDGACMITLGSIEDIAKMYSFKGDKI